MISADDKPPALVDVNVTLGRWPFRRLPGDETAALVARLRRVNVTQAWVGSFEGLFHRDLAGVNRRLADECRAPGRELLVPFGSVNPLLPDWEEDLRRCHEDLRMPGIRLHPNYHGYRLTEPAFHRLLALARERRLLVQIVVSMEDERSQNPVFRVPHVDVTPLAALLRTLPGLRLIVLNAFRSVSLEQAGTLGAAGQVSFDLAMLEGSAGVGRLIDTVGAERVLFGSHFPLFVVESALLKLHEAELPAPLRNRLAAENAGRQLSR